MSGEVDEANLFDEGVDGSSTPSVWPPSDEEQESDAPLTLEGDRKLVTQPYDYSIRQLVDEIDREKILLDIEYQRQYVWDDGKASRLVESLLLNVPIPVCYFAEDDDLRFEVIDGLQRITSLRRFLKDEFRLSGLTVLSEISGKRFSELPPRDRARLENRAIRCVAITADSHPDIKFDVFERLNSNVATLTPQEIRNCIYRGNFNTSLKAAVRGSKLADLVGSQGSKRMVSEELLLRWLTLTQGLEGYRPPLRQALNQYMRSHRNEEIPSEVREDFFRSLELALDVFGPDVFKVPDRAGAVHNVLNKAMFDAVMVSLKFADHGAIRENASKLEGLVPRLLADSEFRASLGRATADRARVFLRIRMFSKALEDAGVGTTVLPIVNAVE